MSDTDKKQGERLVVCPKAPGMPVVVKTHELTKICPWCHRRYGDH